jgi:hypothetical protein
LEECRRYLDGIRSQGRDHEFDTRISLLRAKISPASDPGPHFADLEKECLRNNYRELLWEVYQAWAQSCLRRKSREEALEKFEKGFQIIEGIASTLPEEYQTRYRNQRARKKFVEEREAASASDKGGIFSRFKKIF